MRSEDDVQVGGGGHGVSGDLDFGVLIPVAVLLDDGFAAGGECITDTLLAGVTGLVTDGAGHDQGATLGAVQFLADVLAEGGGGGEVIGLDQGGDIRIVNGGIGGQQGDAGGLGLGDGVFEDGRIDRADDDGIRLGSDLGVDGLDLGVGVLGFGGQVDEFDALSLSFGGGGFTKAIPVIVAGGIAGVRNRDRLGRSVVAAAPPAGALVGVAAGAQAARSMLTIINPAKSLKSIFPLNISSSLELVG